MRRQAGQGGRVLENPSPLGEGDFSLEKSGEGLNPQKSPLPILINQNLPLPQAREGAFFIALDSPGSIGLTLGLTICKCNLSDQPLSIKHLLFFQEEFFESREPADRIEIAIVFNPTSHLPAIQSEGATQKLD